MERRVSMFSNVDVESARLGRRIYGLNKYLRPSSAPPNSLMQRSYIHSSYYSIPRAFDDVLPRLPYFGQCKGRDKVCQCP
jgi:hypothetical protein